MAKEGNKTTAFLEEIYPAQDVKEALDISKVNDEREEWRHLMADMKLNKFYKALAKEVDWGDLTDAGRMIYFSLWKRGLKGDTPAAKTFIERFDRNYKPTNKFEQAHTIQGIKPITADSAGQVAESRARIMDLAGAKEV